jgi:hypothetical protein
MRIFKSLTKDRKTVITISLWGEDEDFKENAKQLLEELLKELN